MQKYWSSLLIIVVLGMTGCESLLVTPTPTPTLTPYQFLTATPRPTTTVTPTMTPTRKITETPTIETPSATPTLTPTITKTPRPVRGAKTPTITPTELGVCAAPPEGVFATLMENDPGLPPAMGCTTSPPDSTELPQIWIVDVLYQPFERGYMLRLSNVGWYETPAIYVLTDDGIYTIYDDTYEASTSPTRVAGEQPPDGLYVPTGALYKIWHEIAGLHDRIGYATDLPSDEPQAQMQLFEYGEMVFLPALNTVFVMRRGAVNSWAAYQVNP